MRSDARCVWTRPEETRVNPSGSSRVAGALVAFPELGALVIFQDAILDSWRQEWGRQCGDSSYGLRRQLSDNQLALPRRGSSGGARLAAA